MSKKKIALSSLVFVLVGYGIGRYAQPAKVVEVEKVVTKDQVKTITVVKEIKKPDGTVIKETKDITDTKKEVQKDTSKTVVKNDPNWMVGPMIGKDSSFQTTMGGMVNYRVAGPFWVGAHLIPVGTKAQGGFQFLYEF